MQAVLDTTRKARPGEIFPEAHFHVIAELQTSPRADGDVEI